MDITLVSNGYGEDHLATALGQALMATAEGQVVPLRLQAAALVGDGWAYRQGFAPDMLIPLPVKTFPSEGFLRTPADWLKDLKAGLMQQVLAQRQRLGRVRAGTVVAVGDFFALWMARTVRAQKWVFVPTAKSDRFQPHLSIEKFFMRRWCQQVFARDPETAEALQHQGIAAEYVGNLMMDCLDGAGEISDLQDAQQVLGILPGSRHEAYTNLALLRETLQYLHSRHPELKFVLALPPSLDETYVQSILGYQLPVILCRDKFKQVLEASTVVLGMAGTANEQAVGLGKPVVCFPGKGLQTTRLRFEEQAKLLLGGVYVTDGPIQAAEKIQFLLDHVEQLQLHRNLAEKAMGQPGAAQRMAARILALG